MSKRPRISDSIRVDRELTAQRFSARIYQDPRSCVHWDGKEYLAGVDVGIRRREVWERDKRRCVLCGVSVTWEQMEMDHIARNCGERRWDNLENLRTLCGPFQNGCHRGSKHAKHA